MNISGLLLIGTALALGLRHGVDWDHIAAITDISGSQKNKKTALLNGMSYAFGHGAVIVIFGLLAVLLGVKLPSWIDNVMEPVVGLTLVVLGLWLLISISINRTNFKLVSKWGLLFKGVQQLHHQWQHFLGKHHHPHLEVKTNGPVDTKSAFGVGMIHGIGAETPTQLLIFVTVAGVSGAFIGVLLVLSFVLGLLISNASITLLSIYGLAKIQKYPQLYLSLGSINGVLSVALGLLYLTGNGAVLPSILGG